MERTLISFDTDQIKNYVFATGILKEIRGASSILDELNRIEMPAIISRLCPSKKIIYANGGSGLFEAETEKANECILAVGRKYYQETKGAGSITGAVLPYSGDFKVDYQTLSLRLRLAKGDKFSGIQPVAHSLLRPCDSCGREYASIYKEGELLCSGCGKKREKDLEIKNEIRKCLQGQFDGINPQKLWPYVIKQLQKSSYKISDVLDRPDDFNELGQMSRPKNYIALLYADGNNMGKEIENISSIEEMSDFSYFIDEAIRHAVIEAIKKHLQPRNKKFPFDLLLLGGDDLVMVTVADKALEIASFIEESFLNYTSEKLKKQCSVSIGVVIAHSKFPFSNMLELAEDLLKFAKKEGGKRKTTKGLINFQVISASNSLAFSKDFQKVYVKDSLSPSNGKLYRTLRPYSAENMRELLNQILAFRDFPRNKLQALQEAVFFDYNNSTLQTLAIMCRLKSDQRRKIVDSLQLFSKNGELRPPWFRNNGDYYTPFLDIAEIFDFVR